ncbi:MAG: tRNA preQ1(34) S-adenosylmethionine ribosyltransferase-isomerase QueA [Candidatus Obscuribacterales bacterium]|nr:tRNA preQ1(34) S-adenosylmethionine ribosyltransferase-isomerase QueA [Candidatus Obscuribacterales bacterium]
MTRVSQSFCLEDLNYELPPELIAQEPLSVRHESRLLMLDRQTGDLSHCKFSQLKDLLKKGDLLVVNNTRVIPARFFARRESGGIIELLLIKQDQSSSTVWQAMGSPLRRLKKNESLNVIAFSGSKLKVTVLDLITDKDGFKRVVLDLHSNENLNAILEQAGHAPLPPYIERAEPRHEDLSRYQTIFASSPGAVAAPTAGLHFSEAVVQGLAENGIELAYITLHVGPGTFKPITTSIDEHSIEPETYWISEATATTINTAKKDGRRVIAVGTTTLRTLESACDAGLVKAAEAASTSLYIKPGHKFNIVEGLLTNFHLSGSSLLVLVATFAGKDAILDAYRQAIDKRYRYFSYGDAMLIL